MAIVQSIEPSSPISSANQQRANHWPGRTAMSNMIFNIRLTIEAIRAILHNCFNLKSQKGIHMMEYALLGVLIGIALIVSIQNLSNMIIEMYNTITTAFPWQTSYSSHSPPRPLPGCSGMRIRPYCLILSVSFFAVQSERGALIDDSASPAPIRCATELKCLSMSLWFLDDSAFFTSCETEFSARECTLWRQLITTTVWFDGGRIFETGPFSLSNDTSSGFVPRSTGFDHRAVLETLLLPDLADNALSCGYRFAMFSAISDSFSHQEQKLMLDL